VAIRIFVALIVKERSVCVLSCACVCVYIYIYIFNIYVHVSDIHERKRKRERAAVGVVVDYSGFRSLRRRSIKKLRLQVMLTYQSSQ
jgi:hypothetical protein